MAQFFNKFLITLLAVTSVTASFVVAIEKRSIPAAVLGMIVYFAFHKAIGICGISLALSHTRAAEAAVKKLLPENTLEPRHVKGYVDESTAQDLFGGQDLSGNR